MKRAMIIVKGRVQRVGYRDLVADNAIDLRVAGYVENQPDGTEKIDRGKEEIVTEIRSLSQPFSFRKRKALAEKKKNSFKLKSFFDKAFFSKETFEDKFARIEHEIGIIKAKIGMV